ncbi:hypothetical protein MGYG_05982 [Nannizzia gypsea CBS 118893]|uniref:Uncharacterized protein n=1 Tax=Arthroderma gypseum (strain ATCC MYA-4604 / CBS 118893) TaxID=535722 RepID=E4V047_ARTGP|nr:hypothetical protein MGYG_05982 [Nannizzia gypsea CBS 118893]EFR02984.1 hypothetical protein MGYG_05982 [Nannizzia gypsea CBS 118893]
MAAAPKMTRSLSLESMPLDILCIVCERVVECDPSRQSLYSFSLASRRCSIAAVRQRLRRVQITLETRKKLANDLAIWNHILKPHGNADYVQLVRINGSMRLEYGRFAPRTETEEQQDDEWGTDLNWHCDNDSVWEYGEKKVCTDVILYGGDRPLTDEEKQSQEAAWRPLVKFIKNLSGLKDLIYASTDQIPPCMLEALHLYHPKSRLHMRQFTLHSLFQLPNSPQDISPEEYALVTSPCLYSICPLLSNYDIQGRASFNAEAILQMVAGLAPNLRYVSIEVPVTFFAQMGPKPAWRGFFVNKPREEGSSEPTGNLRSLSFNYTKDLASSALRAWSCHTDFSKLHILRVTNNDGVDIIRTLGQMAAEGKFRSLLSVSLRLYPHAVADAMILDEEMAGFLRNMPPLKELQLTGSVAERTFNAILEKHGDTLLRLDFTPSRKHAAGGSLFVPFNSEVREIQKRCPNLRMLGLLIPRTNGNKDEVDIYRTLGELKYLKHIILTFDFSNVIHYTHGSIADACDDKLYIGHNALVSLDQMCETFKNLAIDGNLALSVFRVIATTNRLAYPSKLPSLQYLKLQSRGHGEFGSEVFNDNLADIAKWLGGTWVCTKLQEHGDFDKAVTKEAEWFERKFSEGKIEVIFDVTRPGIHSVKARFYRKVWQTLWQTLWPGPTDGRQWMHNWSSFPFWPGSPDGRKWVHDWSSFPLLEE